MKLLLAVLYLNSVWAADLHLVKPRVPPPFHPTPIDATCATKDEPAREGYLLAWDSACPSHLRWVKQ
jgi:hypothetical protein